MHILVELLSSRTRVLLSVYTLMEILNAFSQFLTKTRQAFIIYALC
jgi:hypothetical protein